MNELATQPAGEMTIDHATSQIERGHLPLSLMPPEQMLPILNDYTERRRTFRDWLFEQLIPGVHFGTPPGCEPKRNNRGDPIDFKGNVIRKDQWQFKHSLYKAGAELLCDLLMMRPSFVCDEAAWKMLGSVSGMVVIRCDLIACNESPFFRDWRKGDVVGNGHGSESINDQKRRDSNGAVKMAEKRAKVGAVIHALNLSDLFTQDIEDRVPSPQPKPDPAAPRVSTREERRAAAEANPVIGPAANEPRPADDGPPRVTAQMLTGLYAIWKLKSRQPDSVTIRDFCEMSRALLKTESQLSRPSDWSIDAYDVVKEAIGA